MIELELAHRTLKVTNKRKDLKKNINLLRRKVETMFLKMELLKLKM